MKKTGKEITKDRQKDGADLPSVAVPYRGSAADLRRKNFFSNLKSRFLRR